MLPIELSHANALDHYTPLLLSIHQVCAIGTPYSRIDPSTLLSGMVSKKSPLHKAKVRRRAGGIYKSIKLGHRLLPFEYSEN